MNIKLIIGLGNPGEKYLKTRHNIGFILLDLLADEYSAKFNKNQTLNSEIAEVSLEGEKIILCKPQTFMNNSGQAVSKIVNYYKIDLKDILIIQDELDLPFGKIRISADSSSAGHKGIQSIINFLGTKNFKRLRFGINNNESSLPPEIFVLKNFSKEELTSIQNFDTEAIISSLNI